MNKPKSKRSFVLSKDEIETDVTIDYVTRLAYVYSCHSATCKRLLKLAAQYPNDVDVDLNNGISVSVYVPLQWIKISPPRKHTMSDEKRVQMIEQLAAARAIKGAIS